MPDMTIDEFLTARLDEREADTRGLYEPGDLMFPTDEDVLADIAAKREIVRAYRYRADRADEHVITAAHSTGLLIAVKWLTSVYADHPDYREEWKP